MLKLPFSHVCPFLLTYHRLLWAAAQPNTSLLISWRHLHCPHRSLAVSAPIHELLCKLSSLHSSRVFFFSSQETKICSKWKLSSMEQNRKKHKLYFLDHYSRILNYEFVKPIPPGIRSANNSEVEPLAVFAKCRHLLFLTSFQDHFSCNYRTANL